MLRDLVRLSLLVLLVFNAGIRPAPWRDSDLLQTTAELPKRLIDSIMAQGNWNILFQEGPFNEFQRQIAVANHFALRGDAENAKRYFDRAANALEIAYASLRGKFSWPRRSTEIHKAELTTAESRNVFQDYLLCRLQLYIETALREHESGNLYFAELESTLMTLESQWGGPIQNKDAELVRMIELVRVAVKLRGEHSHPTLHAQKFATYTNNIVISDSGYWQRQIIFFAIFENIYYGNLVRSRFLANTLWLKQQQQLDTLTMARIFVHALSPSEALHIMDAAQSEELTPENFDEIVAIGDLSQRLLVLTNQISLAQENSQKLENNLQALQESQSIAREDLVRFRKILLNQKLRGQMLGFLLSAKCNSTELLDTENRMSRQWQIRERIFKENCGLKRDRNWWLNFLAGKPSDPELTYLAMLHLSGDVALTNILATQKISPATTPFSQTIAALLRLREVQSRGHKTEIVKATLSYLENMNSTHAGLVFLDWGLLLTDSANELAYTKWPHTLSPREANQLFQQLRQDYAFKNFDERFVAYLSPPDSSTLRKKILSSLLDVNLTTPEILPVQLKSGFLYLHNAQKFAIVAKMEKQVMHLFIATENADLFAQLDNTKEPVVISGNVMPVLQSPNKNKWGELVLAPLAAFCEECASHSKGAERLLTQNQNQQLRSLVSELADNFSSAPEPDRRVDCFSGVQNPRDTILIATPLETSGGYPCNFNPERIVVEYDDQSETAASPPIWATLGWRPDLSLILIPKSLTEQAKTSLLYDYFQRSNRRQLKNAQALQEARSRAEKSFPNDRALRGVYLYESAR